MTSPIKVGQKLLPEDINPLFPQFCLSTVNTAYTSTTTIANVTGMSIPMIANTTYLLDGYIKYTATNVGDLDLTFSVPAGVTGSWCGLGILVTDTVGDTATFARADSFTTELSFGGAAGGALCVPITGTVVVAGTAGNLQLRAAQNTSNANATTVLAGSWMRLQRAA